MLNDGTMPGNPRKSAKSGFIPQKQAWLDQVATDRKLTPAALRVAILLSNGFNSETLETFIGRETMARKLCIAAPNVSKAVRLLKDRGHVAVRAVRRNNHYKMIVISRPPEVDPVEDVVADNERTGMNSDTSQVLKSTPNRYEDQYTNREANRPADSAGGASAPTGEQSEDRSESETRLPEGARHNNELTMTIDEAIEELAALYVGTLGDREEAVTGLESALAKGVGYAKLEYLVRHADNDDITLDDFLWDIALPPEDQPEIDFGDIRDNASLLPQADGLAPTLGEARDLDDVEAAKSPARQTET